MPELVPIPSPGIPLTYGDPGDALIVVLPDRFGRLPWLEPYAAALANQGFRVSVLDLYEGVATIDPRSADELDGRLDDVEALDAVYDVIAAERAAGSPRVGLIGFGSGGRLALLSAQTGTADAVVAYYAQLAEPEHTLIPCPVLLQVDEAGDQAAMFIIRLAHHGTPVSNFTYVGTRPGFANATVAADFDKNAAALAFARAASFLDTQLSD